MLPLRHLPRVALEVVPSVSLVSTRGSGELARPTFRKISLRADVSRLPHRSFVDMQLLTQRRSAARVAVLEIVFSAHGQQLGQHPLLFGGHPIGRVSVVQATANRYTLLHYKVCTTASQDPYNDIDCTCTSLTLLSNHQLLS